MDVIPGVREAGKVHQEIQDDPHIRDSITPYEVRAMAVRSKMDTRNRVGFKRSERLYEERHEILY